MRILRIYLIYSLFVIFLILNGCTSTGTPTEIEEITFTEDDLTNRLTLFGETLFLPGGWAFIPNTDSKGTLFNFRSPQGVEGGLEIINFDYDIVFDKLVDFYKEYVFKSDKKIRSEALAHERFGTVVTFKGVANDRTLLSLLFADGNNVTFLHFSSSDENPFPIEKALLILDTYEKDERAWISVREMGGFPLFTSFDNTWYWYGDFKDGYYLARKGEKSAQDIIAGLWTLNNEEINQLKTDAGFNIEPFIYNYRVRNLSTEFKVYGNTKEGSTSRLYTLFKLDDKTYCLYLIQDSIDEGVDIVTLLEKPEIQNLLDFHILFSDGI
ncbi:MAG: hypothetical protein U9N32_01795 [Spirochaetota bacterium]|nr:hypothetical protein [Spirochaetota bacterium]